MREMKDSGVEWIGKIPKDWEIVPLTKQLDSIVDYRGKTPEKTEEGTFLVTAKNIKDGKICYELSKEYVREADYEEIMHRGIPQIGDILFTTEAPLGQVANVDRTDIALAQRIIKFRALSTVNNYYLKYWMLNEGFQQFLHSLSTGSTATGIKSSKLFLLPLVRPNIEQQNKIVEYLDAKCSKIDEIVEKQKVIIEKLEEYKLSIITEAVTSGINPDVEMKDSGSVWFGNIPINWEMKRLKYVFHIQKDIAGEEGHTVLSITQRGIIPKDFSNNEGQFANSYANYQLVHKGDFAMNHMDLLTGWVDISKYEGVTSPDYRVFVLNDKNGMCPKYYLYMMQMCYSARIFYGLGQGVSGMGRWRLQADKFLNFYIPIPPYDEQKKIADYITDILMPPDGYRLDRAVGTTYSLDLEALTAVAICLGLSEETDSKLMQNPIGMLNALQKVSDKIVLFCEAGQIKVPTKPTALSILLEKMVVEVALPKDRQLGRYPSFHPKTWVLAYVNADGDKKYRFVVMSRNLTFDRSWDISFAMDSSKNVRQKKKTQPICDFLDYLVMNVHNTSNNAGKKRNLIRGLCADIKDVSFSLDSKIFGEDFEVLPLGIGKNAYRMQEDILFCKERGNANSTFNELVVMSPFLSESVIADFNLTDRALSDCKRTLVTRRSELGKLKASDVDNFTIYALKDEIIDGEEEISDELADKKKQDIHAKIYLRRKYSDVDLYLGSMNASYSAINKNVEMMLWLGTKNMYLNGDKFLEDIFCGPVGDAKNPFEQVTVADAVLETESDNRNLLEQKIKDLCRVKRQAVISEDNENAGKYKIEVEFSGIESDSEVTVSPFNSKQEQTLSEHIEFSELEILQLSEFYEITARSGDDTIRRIIMIPTSGFPDDRESAAVNSVVKDRASFVEYIAFVLGDDYVASMLEGKQMGESGFFANSSDAMPALYEKMLKTSVEGPERIKDIGYVLKMVTDKDIIPDEFRELYETFCNTLKIRR